MRTMRVFTEGRLASYERMMQDYGDRNRHSGKKRTESADTKKVIAMPTAKAGDSHARSKS